MLDCHEDHRLRIQWPMLWPAVGAGLGYYLRDLPLCLLDRVQVGLWGQKDAKVECKEKHTRCRQNLRGLKVFVRRCCGKREAVA